MQDSVVNEEADLKSTAAYIYIYTFKIIFFRYNDPAEVYIAVYAKSWYACKTTDKFIQLILI